MTIAMHILTEWGFNAWIGGALVVGVAIGYSLHRLMRSIRGDGQRYDGGTQ